MVADAAEAYHTSVKHGGKGVLEPLVMQDSDSGKTATISEVGLYGDVVLR
jgi:4-hydroxyphenylpyruvate dioxygenase